MGERLSPGERPPVLHQVWFSGHVVGGDPRTEANGSTDDARWVPLADVGSLPCSREVIEVLDGWRRHHPGGWVPSSTWVTTGE